MATTIPVREIVKINANVLAAGGGASDISGLILTKSTLLNEGELKTFNNSDEVATFFGATSDQAIMAEKYFNGYENATTSPKELLFYRDYIAAPGSAIATFNVGIADGTLPVGQTITSTSSLPGVVVVNGVTVSVPAAAFATATTKADIITALNTALGVNGTATSAGTNIVITASNLAPNPSLVFQASWDFWQIGPAVGTQTPFLTRAQITSYVTTPTRTGMELPLSLSRNWAFFTTDFAVSQAEFTAFAQFVSNAQQANRFGYVLWDDEGLMTVPTINFTNLIATNNYANIVRVYNDIETAAFFMGAAASVDFARLNSRITFMFKKQAGLAAGVTNSTDRQTLLNQGINFVGSYATANADFTFFENGRISGKFLWADEFVNQVWLHSSFERRLIELLQAVPSIPYNNDGYYGLIAPSLQDDITAAINFGAIRTGVSLSSSQAAIIRNAVGIDISQTLFSQGYYLQILDPGAVARNARTSPIINFWYTSGGAIHSININSILVL